MHSNCSILMVMTFPCLIMDRILNFINSKFSLCFIVNTIFQVPYFFPCFVLLFLSFSSRFAKPKISNSSMILPVLFTSWSQLLPHSYFCNTEHSMLESFLDHQVELEASIDFKFKFTFSHCLLCIKIHIHNLESVLTKLKLE